MGNYLFLLFQQLFTGSYQRYYIVLSHQLLVPGY